MAQPTEQEIDRVVNGYNHANDAADYADTIVCETELISGENYRMIWSTEYNGHFVPNGGN